MATTKKTTKKMTAMPKPMSAAEYDRFINLIDKARVMAYKISIDPSRGSDVRSAMRSIEKKLSNIRTDYYWGRITNYIRP